MKAKIIVTPKKAVVDPQGKTVQNALAHMGYNGVTAVHVGKYIEIDLAPGTDRAGTSKVQLSPQIVYSRPPAISVVCHHRSCRKAMTGFAMRKPRHDWEEL